jgi:signal transduction histidine kinase
MENWARKVNARIAVHSEPGKGASLEVIVPHNAKEK